MDTKEFCFWLKGFLEVTRTSQIEPAQVDIIRAKLEESIIIKIPKPVNNISMYPVIENEQYIMKECK